MNRGLLSGFGKGIGDYNPMPSGGTQAGRGRLQVDELRMWGHPDNVAQPTAASVGPWPGAARLYNTNPQAKVGNLFYTGDQGTVINVLNGPILSNSSFPPFEAAFNTAGQVVFGPGAGLAQMFGFVTNTQMKNLPGVSANVPSFDFASSNCLFTADGATATQSAFNDFSSSPAFQVINSGTFTQGGVTNYVAGGGSGGTGAGAGLTIAARTGFKVNNFNILSGVLTSQYGVDIDLQVAGAANTALRIGGVATTLTAAIPGGQQIDIWPALMTLNFASATMNGSFVNSSGTVQLSQSASGFGIISSVYNYAITWKNTTTVAANLAATVGYHAAPKFIADGATISINNTLPTAMFQASPSTSVLNAGTLSTGVITNYASTANIGASTTIATLTDYQVSEATVGGTLTTHIGHDIAALTLAATNIGIRIGAMTNPIQMAMATTGPTTGNLTSNTNGVMTLYHGATNYYLLFAFNDAGTVRYKYLQLNGTGTTWAQGTALPT
jgi:hypothetical protein